MLGVGTSQEICYEVNSVNLLTLSIFLDIKSFGSKWYQGRKHTSNATKYACDKQIKIIRRTFPTWGSLVA